MRQTARLRLSLQFSLADYYAYSNQLVGEFNLRLNLPDPHQYFAAQFRRYGITAAMLCDQTFDRFLETELPEARTALIKVLPNALAVGLGQLPV
jgi:hypothetical protein